MRQAIWECVRSLKGPNEFSGQHAMASANRWAGAATCLTPLGPTPVDPNARGHLACSGNCSGLCREWSEVGRASRAAYCSRRTHDGSGRERRKR